VSPFCRLPDDHRAIGDVAVFGPLSVGPTCQTVEPVSGAQHQAVVPPPLPAHDQFHGPDPFTVDAAPAENRFEEGAPDTGIVPADPHAPLTLPELPEELPDEAPEEEPELEEPDEELEVTPLDEPELPPLPLAPPLLPPLPPSPDPPSADASGDSPLWPELPHATTTASAPMTTPSSLPVLMSRSLRPADAAHVMVAPFSRRQRAMVDATHLARRRRHTPASPAKSTTNGAPPARPPATLAPPPHPAGACWAPPA
jgi:hypothetical protein